VFRILALALLGSLAVTPVFADTDDQRWAGNIEMNGFKLDTFEDFASKWNLVTVRYRVDSGEFRFTYANPLAEKHLRAGKTDYPDGAVFAKVSYVLSNDPIFTSSMTPEKVQRYQLMVKNKKKFGATDGWGYALFNANGKTYPGEPQAVSMACAACHKIAAERGGVFSSPIEPLRHYFNDKKPSAEKRVQSRAYAPKFEAMKVEQLPKDLRDLLPKDMKTVRSLQGDLRKNIFQGTLDEVRPFLAAESLRSGAPAILLSQEGLRFSIVYQAQGTTGGCSFGGDRKGLSMISILTLQKASPFSEDTAYISTDGDSSLSKKQEFCFVQEP